MAALSDDEEMVLALVHPLVWRDQLVEIGFNCTVAGIHACGAYDMMNTPCGSGLLQSRASTCHHPLA